MRKLLISLGVLAGLTFAGQAHAEIDWSYIGDKSVAITAGGSTVTFLGTVGGAANNTGVVIFNITASSTTGNDGAPDHFDASKFGLTVSIIDEKARASKNGGELGTVTFTGFFTADVTKGSLTNWGVSWAPGGDEGVVTLGNKIDGFRKYDVKVDGFLPPSPNAPVIAGQGSVHANVIVTPVDGGGNPGDGGGNPQPSETPEPATLLLAGLGLSGCGAYSLRRRKKANA